MYISLYDLKKMVTDYQLGLLVLLRNGSKIVTNEGTHFRAWLETDNEVNKSVLVRKDVANKMNELGLLTSVSGRLPHLFYYSYSSRASTLLDMIDDKRMRAVVNRLARNN